jgi:hypothetical protein
MAKRKNQRTKPLIILIVIVTLAIVSAVLLQKYGAEKAYKDAVSQNSSEDKSFDYKGTTIEETPGLIKVKYTRLGTGFSYELPEYSNLEIDTSGSEDIPNLKYKNIMPYTDSSITFSYVDPDQEYNYEGEELSTKHITVDGHSARIVEAEQDYIRYGYGQGYRYHVYVVVDNVNQARRFSSKDVEVTPRKFVIHGSTGDTTDERAKDEILEKVNELLPTLKFTQN